MASRVTGRSLSPSKTGSRVAPVPAWDFQGGRTAQPRCGIRTARHQGSHEMRCYTGQLRFYCGVDLHARTMFTHVLDAGGQTVFEKDLPTRPDVFLVKLPAELGRHGRPRSARLRMRLDLSRR